MPRSNKSERVSVGVSRRGMLAGTAVMGVGVATTVGGSAALAQTSNRDEPMKPVPIPQQVPAREGIAELPDTKLWYWDTGGDGKPIVLMHPISGSALTWVYQQPVFAKAGYRVIAYSRRSHYKSAPFDPAKPVPLSEDLHNFVNVMGLQKFHLVAVSAGGATAVDFAHSHPERLLSLSIGDNFFGVRSGAIYEAGMRIRPKTWDDMPFEFRELGASYRAVNPDGMAKWIEQHKISFTGSYYPQLLANKITDTSLAQLKVPVLIMVGTGDLSSPPSITRMIANVIPGSEFLVVPEAGHSVYWEQPHVFNRAVLDFVAKHSA